MDIRAKELLHAHDTGEQIQPLTQSGVCTIEEAYAIAGQISDARVARGERIVGRKIGFTNRSIWDLYGVDAPMWAPMYDTTVSELPDDGHVTLPRQAELRIEPEIAFCFKETPQIGMSLYDIAACIDWMAHGFEIVTSPFPGWSFKLPDCTAAQSLHAFFWYGPQRPLPKDINVLETFSLRMTGPRGVFKGNARDVLDGPLHAVRFLLAEIGKMPGAAAIQPGEILTTGTLTDAGPVATGDTWQTEFFGIDLPGSRVVFV